MSVYEPTHVELIPGTALPLRAPGEAEQTEGRGDVIIRRDREPRSLFEKIDDPDYLSGAERAVVTAALRAYDSSPRQVKTVYVSAQAQADATTGNAVLALFQTPMGFEGHVQFATLDSPIGAVTPSAPLANGAIFAFLAKWSPSDTNVNAVNLRQGAIDFSPQTPAPAGASLPARWSYGEEGGPVIFGGEMLYACLVGGSVAGALGLSLLARARLSLSRVSSF